MFRTVLALIVLCVCAGLGYLIRTFPATVILDFPDQIASFSLISWLLWSLLAAFVLLGFLRVVWFLWRSPQRFSRSSYQRKKDKAQRFLQRGIAEMVSGRYEKAEKFLVQGGDLAEEIGISPVVYFENAAIAADHIGQTRRRDQHLIKARQHAAESPSSFSTRLNEAQMHIDHGDFDRALILLEDLRREERDNVKVAQLLDTAYLRTEQWSKAWANLPKLAPRLESKALYEKQKRYARGLLDDRAAAVETAAELASAWQKLPQTLRHDSALQIQYASILAENGHHKAATDFLESLQESGAVKLDIVQAYSQIQGDAPAQLQHLLRWEKGFENNAVFAFAKAQVAFRAKDYPTAAQAIEIALRENPTPAAFALWAQILEATDQPEAALNAYRESVARLRAPIIQGEVLPIAGQLPSAQKPA